MPATPTLVAPTNLQNISNLHLGKISAHLKWFENEFNPLITFEVVCMSPNWCAFGMNSKYPKMSGMEAVVCVGKDVGLYQTNSGNVKPKNIGLKQYLSSVSCTQNKKYLRNQ
jgi:hypothetical protein